jgi:hypothetical protein
MITLNNFKHKLLESSGLLDTFSYQGRLVSINKNLDIVVDSETIDVEVDNLEEARQYAKTHIDTALIVEEIDTVIPEEKVVTLIRKYHNIEKITDTLVESYIELASSNLFSIDPVIVEMKQRASTLPGKLEYTLNDGSVVAINEDTQNLLNTLLKDKYQVVEYMRESKENFTRIIKEVI